LKETRADLGELMALRWIDVDSKNRTLTINHPVKGHNPRILPISGKLLDMLQRLQKRSERVFENMTEQAMYCNFYPQRKKAAIKLANPRLQKISFVTLRHWKGTMEYHKTKDIIHVKNVLGHKNIESTMIYINLEQAHFTSASEEFTVRVAKTVDEACKLIEAGFEYVTDMESVKLFRKRK
jgi:integrase